MDVPLSGMEATLSAPDGIRLLHLSVMIGCVLLALLWQDRALVAMGVWGRRGFCAFIAASVLGLGGYAVWAARVDRIFLVVSVCLLGGLFFLGRRILLEGSTNNTQRTGGSLMLSPVVVAGFLGMFPGPMNLQVGRLFMVIIFTACAFGLLCVITLVDPGAWLLERIAFVLGGRLDRIQWDKLNYSSGEDSDTSSTWTSSASMDSSSSDASESSSRSSDDGPGGGRSSGGGDSSASC